MADIKGTELNETFLGSPQNDTIDGGDGLDTIEGGAGDDLLIGSAHTGSVSWGSGRPFPVVKNSDPDVYLFGAGFGQDTISEDENIARFDASFGGAFQTGPTRDVIRLDASFSPDGVELDYADDYHLKLRVKGSTDSILFNVGVYQAPDTFGLNFVDNPDNLPLSGAGVEVIEFADGTIWDTVATMRRLASRQLQGDDGNNALTGGMADDTLIGGAGDDTLIGWRGRDVFNGGAGHDLIDAATIGTAGARRDSAPDTITFGVGDGHDTVLADDTDTISLGAGLSRDSLRVGPLLGKGTDSGSPNLGSPGDNLERFTTLSFNEADSLTVKLFQGQFSQFTLAAIQFADGSSLSLDQIRQQQQAQGTVGTEGADMLMGWAGGSNHIEGRAGNDSIYGGAGSQDVVSGGAGNDLIDVADRVIMSDSVADTVLFGLGDGQDTVRVDGNDTIALGAGLTRAGLSVSPSSTDPYEVTLSWGKDRITLRTAAIWENSAQNLVNLKFADGSPMSSADLAALMPRTTVRGTAFADSLEGGLLPVNMAGQWGNDTLGGSRWNDSMDGGAGRDMLSGGLGDDTLLGQAGDDFLVGGIGSDRLDGGAGRDNFYADDYNPIFIYGGNDTMIGGAGADTYNYGGFDVQGSRGNDIILDYDINTGNQDQLSFDRNYRTDQLWFARSGSDLTITLLGENQGGTVTVQRWFTSSAYRIEQIKADGEDGGQRTLTASRVTALVSAMAAFAPPASGATGIDASTEAKLATVLASSWK